MDRLKTLVKSLGGTALCGLLTAAAMGCSPGTETMDMTAVDLTPLPATFANLKPIFNRSCNFSSCHQVANQAYGNLKLSGTDAYCNLVGQATGGTFRDTAKATFPRRVTAGDRGQSYLYKKLVLTDAEDGRTKPLGMRMPQGAMLDALETDLFGRWIDGGAKDEPGQGPCQ